MSPKPLTGLRVFRTLRYPLYLACGLVGVGGYAVSTKRFKEEVSFEESEPSKSSSPSYVEISLIKLMPFRIVSRIWGHLNSYKLPKVLREPMYKTFCDAYNCDLSEAEVQDLKQFRNLQEFFTRSLKPELRPISEKDITSPCDGKILSFGKVSEDKVDQVKGAVYSLPAFFGPITWKKNQSEGSEESFATKLLENPSLNSLYHCVIYLAPGDYHRFHSPADWHVNFRRHFSGKLILVKPCFANWIDDLFSLNERALYIGKWAHGFFSLCAVAATNVGSIQIYFDETLATNKSFNRKYIFKDRLFNIDIIPSKGEPFGQFNLGSTVVLIFEAPKDFAFDVKAGQRIKYGQALGSNTQTTE